MAHIVCARLLLPLMAVLSAGATQIQLQPLVVTAGDPDSDLYRTPPGSGYDGVAALTINGARGCTGAMLSTGYLLTAAHCLTDATGSIDVLSLTATFFPGGTPEVLNGSGYIVHPDWSGVIQSGADVALVVLSGAPSAGVQRYDIYDGSDEIGASYDFSGFGVRGTGSTGATSTTAARRRGWNTFDATMTNTFAEFGGTWTGGDDILVSDFDNGLVDNDALDYFYGLPHLGLGIQEALTGPGDSGGPAFINGRIAGINMFRLRLEFDDGSTSDIDGITNSTYGEFNTWARMSSYRDWVHSVPEPSTTALCVLSLAFLGLRARRRRS